MFQLKKKKKNIHDGIACNKTHGPEQSSPIRGAHEYYRERGESRCNNNNNNVFILFLLLYREIYPNWRSRVGSTHTRERAHARTYIVITYNNNNEQADARALALALDGCWWRHHLVATAAMTAAVCCPSKVGLFASQVAFLVPPPPTPYRVPPALNHQRYCLPVRGPIYDWLHSVGVQLRHFRQHPRSMLLYSRTYTSIYAIIILLYVCRWKHQSRKTDGRGELRGRAEKQIQ